MQIVIDTQGGIRCVYSETVDLARLGRMTIARGSHVEPDSAGNWHANLIPVDGPLLGPFDKRSAALAAETRWLCDHWLLRDAAP